MINYEEAPNIIKGKSTKQTTIRSFKRNFYCDFDIELYKNRLFVHTYLPLNVDVEYKGREQKEQIYAFLRYLANVFDFSFTLEFLSIDDMLF